MIYDFKTLLIFGIVDRANIGEMVKSCFRRIVQIARNIHEARGVYGDSRLGTCSIDAGREDRVGEFRLQAVEQSLHRSWSRDRRDTREKHDLPITHVPLLSLVSQSISQTLSPAESFLVTLTAHRAMLQGEADSQAHRHRLE